MKKALPLIVLLAMTFVGLSSCEGHYYDPGAMGGSGGFGTGGFGGGGSGKGKGGGNDLWSKLTTPNSMWVKNDPQPFSITLTFSEVGGEKRCEVASPIYNNLSGSIVVSIDGDTINFVRCTAHPELDGGSATVTFTSSDTLTLSNCTGGPNAFQFNGDYERY